MVKGFTKEIIKTQANLPKRATIEEVRKGRWKVIVGNEIHASSDFLELMSYIAEYFNWEIVDEPIH